MVECEPIYQCSTLEKFDLYCDQDNYEITQINQIQIESNLINNINVLYDGIRFPVYFSKNQHVILFFKGQSFPQIIHTQSEIQILPIQNRQQTQIKRFYVQVQGNGNDSFAYINQIYEKKLQSQQGFQFLQIFKDYNVTKLSNYLKNKTSKFQNQIMLFKVRNDLNQDQIVVSEQLAQLFNLQNGQKIQVDFTRKQLYEYLYFDSVEQFNSQNKLQIGVYFKQNLHFLQAYLNQQSQNEDQIVLYNKQILSILNNQYQIFIYQKQDYVKYRGIVIQNKLKQDINISQMDSFFIQQNKIKCKNLKQQDLSPLFDILYNQYQEQIMEFISSKDQTLLVYGQKNMLKSQFVNKLFQTTDYCYEYIDLADFDNTPKLKQIKNFILLKVEKNELKDEFQKVIVIDNINQFCNKSNNEQQTNINLVSTVLSKYLKKIIKKFNQKFILISDNLENLNIQTEILKIIQIKKLTHKDRQEFFKQFKIDEQQIEEISQISQEMNTGDFRLIQNVQNYDDLVLAVKKYKNDSLKQNKEYPKFKDIGGLTSAKEMIIETFELPQKFDFIFKRLPIKISQGVLLYGTSGCGKTFLAQAAANQLNMNFISVKGPEILNKYIGASEQSVRDIFEKAQNSSPCIIFFDEFDSLVPKRTSGSTSVTDRVVNQFLCYLDGVIPLNQVYILAASSRPDLIDPALLRPGRIDKHVQLTVPDYEERLEILKIITKNDNIFDIDIQETGRKTENFISADIIALFQDINLQKAQNQLDFENIFENQLKQEFKQFKIIDEDIDEALKSFKTTLNNQEIKQMMKLYDDFKNKKVDIKQQKSKLM